MFNDANPKLVSSAVSMLADVSVCWPPDAWCQIPGASRGYLVGPRVIGDGGHSYGV